MKYKIGLFVSFYFLNEYDAMMIILIIIHSREVSESLRGVVAVEDCWEERAVAVLGHREERWGAKRMVAVAVVAAAVAASHPEGD